MAPKRLGEILVARGRLTQDQLRKALQAQMIWGGHLGTNLIELGFVTEDELGEVLAEAHSVQYAPYGLLQEIPGAVLNAIPRGLVEKYKLLPFRFDGKKLHLVMLAPQDLMALDEVSFATGFQLVPYVTPEIRLFQVLEKYYNIPRTKRYITLTREMASRQARAAQAVQPAAPRPAASILEDAPHPRAPRTAPSAAAGSDAPPAPPASADDDAEAYPATASNEWSPRGEARPASPQAGASGELVPEPVEEEAPREGALERLLRSRTLEEVCSALTEEAAATFRRCAVFTRSADGFVAVAGLAATTASSWSLEGVALPFDSASAEALFADRRTYYIGPPPGGVREGPFYDRLGGAVPPNAFLAAVRLQDRLALVFYADQVDEEVRPRDVEGMLSLLQQANLALDLLALRRKDSPA